VYVVGLKKLMGRVCFVRLGCAVGSTVHWLEMFRMECEIKSGFDAKHSNHSLQSHVFDKLHNICEITAEHRCSLHASTSTARHHYLAPTFSDSCRNKELICIPCPLSPTYPSHSSLPCTIPNYVARVFEILQYLVTHLFEEECACLSSHHPKALTAHFTIPAVNLQNLNAFLFPIRNYPRPSSLQHARAKRPILHQNLWKMVFAKVQWCK
jgi:hypothetical protein